jgi:hypothetical protein
LPFKSFGVIHVHDRQSAATRRKMMTNYTIDHDNNITAFGSTEEATAATAGPFDSFTSEKELARLVAGWPAERLIAIWNGLPGVEPVKKFKSAKSAASRIWERIQHLGEAAKPEAEPAKPTADKKAKRGAHVAKGAPAQAKASKKGTPAKNAPKGKTANKAQASTGPREGSKTAQVVAMLQRKGGATLAEIMDKMGWQRHTVRGFMAGAMKKAGHEVESFKSDKGGRTYRINQ